MASPLVPTAEACSPRAMKSFTFHSGSLAVGFGLAALLGVTMGQQFVGTPVSEVRVIEPVVVHTPAHPKNVVLVAEGDIYTVPSDRLLVLHAVVSTDLAGDPSVFRVLVNGQPIIDSQTNGAVPAQAVELPFGLIAGPSSTVQLLVPSSNAKGVKRLIAYLAEDD